MIISITQKNILVQGKDVGTIQQVISNELPLIDALEEELKFQASKSRLQSEADKKKGRSVTIMGDENVPYELLRKILATCREANYTQIAFAAMQKAKSEGEL